MELENPLLLYYLKCAWDKNNFKILFVKVINFLLKTSDTYVSEHLTVLATYWSMIDLQWKEGTDLFRKLIFSSLYYSAIYFKWGSGEVFAENLNILVPRFYEKYWCQELQKQLSPSMNCQLFWS